MDFESIYENSIRSIIDKFISSSDDFFLTEKDLHFHFFHYCLNKNSFEFKNRLLIHTEYPMPFKIRKRNLAEIVGDEEGGAMRPHIDSVLFNKNFVDWILKSSKSKKDIDNCIRGLGNIAFSKYIKDFRKIYSDFYKVSNENFLSHCIEFKFIRGGYEGKSEPVKGIQYDLKKLLLLGIKNENLSIPFSKKCTLLIFVGHRGKNTIKEFKELNSKNPDLFNRFNRKDKLSGDGRHCVIRFDMREKYVR